MNKLLGVLFVVVIAAGIVPLARSIEPPVVPPAGVAKGNWIPMGDAAGFVVVNGRNDASTDGGGNTVKGYFMVRRGGAWMRIDSAPAGTYPAMETH